MTITATACLPTAPGFEPSPSFGKLFLLFIFWSTLIIGPVLNTPVSSAIDMAFLATLCCIIGFFLSGYRLPASFLTFFLLVAAIVVISFFGIVFAGGVVNNDALRGIARPIRGAIIVAGIFAALHFSRSLLAGFSPNVVYSSVLKVIYLATVLQGLLIFLQFISPHVRDFSYQYLSNQEVLDFNKEFRMPGFMGAGGAQLSAVQGIGFFIGIHLLGLGVRRAWLYAVGNLILIGSFVLTGRTGFIFIPIAFASWLTCSIFVRKKAGRNNRLSRGSVFGFGLIAVFLVVLVQWAFSYMESNEGSDWLNTALTRTFDTYLNYIQTGRLEDRTTEILGEMLILPTSISQLLIGDPAFLVNNGRYDSDIGYIRLIWGYGLVGLSLHVACYLWLIRHLLKRSSIRVVGKSHAIFAAWLWLSMLILNYKELFFFSRVTFAITVTCLLGLGLSMYPEGRSKLTRSSCSSSAHTSLK